MFFALLDQSPWSGYSTHEADGTVGYRESVWVLKQDGVVLEDELSLPTFMPMQVGQMYSVSTTLSYDGRKDEMPYGFLHVDHIFCRVLLEGEVLFSYMPEDVVKLDAAKSPGFIYKAFPLPRDCMGKELTVELLPPMDTPLEYGLPDIAFGDFTATLVKSISRDVPHDIVMILCILIGMVSIIFAALTLRGKEFREALNIGIFSLIFAIYMITECQLNAYFIANPYYIYLLNYTAFSLLPLSLMGFMQERLPEKNRKVCVGVITFELTFFIAELIMHFTGYADMREMIPAIHLIYFGEMILLTVLIIIMKDKQKKKSFMLQLVPVLAGMIADLVIYWQHWKIGGNDATFTILGVIIFLVVEMYRVFRTSALVYTDSIRSNLYRKMAFVDELTQVGNRRAYDEEIERIAAGKKAFQSMIVVSADVNRLKYVNDHFGHAAGDKLIRGAAEVMTETVGSSGIVFRTGGDEFAAFLYDVGMPLYEKMCKRAIKQCEKFDCKCQ